MTWMWSKHTLEETDYYLLRSKALRAIKKRNGLRSFYVAFAFQTCELHLSFKTFCLKNVVICVYTGLHFLAHQKLDVIALKTTMKIIAKRKIVSDKSLTGAEAVIVAQLFVEFSFDAPVLVLFLHQHNNVGLNVKLSFKLIVLGSIQSPQVSSKWSEQSVFFSGHFNNPVWVFQQMTVQFRDCMILRKSGDKNSDILCHSVCLIISTG